MCVCVFSPGCRFGEWDAERNALRWSALHLYGCAYLQGELKRALNNLLQSQQKELKNSGILKTMRQLLLCWIHLASVAVGIRSNS